MEVKKWNRERILEGAFFLCLFALIALSHQAREQQCAIPRHVVDPRAPAGEPYDPHVVQKAIFRFDTVLILDGESYSENRKLAFFLATHRPGDSVRFEKRWSNSIYGFGGVICLLPLRSSAYLYLQSIWLVVLLIMAVATYHRRNQRRGVLIVFWVLVTYIVRLSTGGIPFNRDVIDSWWCMRALGDVAFVILAALLMHLTLGYPRKKRYKHNVLLFIYGASALIAAFLIESFVAVQLTEVTDEFRAVQNYHYSWSIAIQIVIPVLLLAMIGIIHTYITSNEASDRRAALWILAGMGLPWLSAIALNFMNVASDVAYADLISAAFPLSLFISIHPYRGLRIEAFYRGLFVLLIVGVLVYESYTILLGFLEAFFGPQLMTTSETLFYTLASVVIVSSFILTGRLVSRALRGRFYRMRGIYRQALDRLEEEIRTNTEIETLKAQTATSVNEVFKSAVTEIVLLENDVDTKHGSKYQGALTVQIERDGIVQIRNAVEDKTLATPFVGPAPNDARLFVSLKTIQLKSLGFIALGEKASGYKYTNEDLEFLQLASRSIGIGIERLILANQMAEQAAEAKSLKAISDFKSHIVGAISHDLKTPISSIKLYSQLLRRSIERGKDIPHLDSFLEIMEGESKRLSAMIDNALDHRRIEQGVMQYAKSVIELNETVQDVIHSFSYLFELQGFSVRCTYETRPILILADPLAVQNILINLLTNAVKFSTQSRCIEVQVLGTSDSALVKVTDHGIGIPAHQQTHIFESFYRVDNSMEGLQARGAGLGLSNVKSMMEHHDGSVNVESVEGHGTTFTITFPILKDCKLEPAILKVERSEHA